MLVRDFMTTQVTCLKETDAMLDAAMIFVRSTLRHLPVLRDKTVVGVLTERDFKRFAPSIHSGISPDEYNHLMESTPISKIMTPEPVTIGPERSMFEAAMILYTKRIGCLPVVEDGELRGIITTTDMLNLLIRLLEKHQSSSPETPELP